VVHFIMSFSVIYREFLYVLIAVVPSSYISSYILYHLSSSDLP
jgi:hypothetical protein